MTILHDKDIRDDDYDRLLRWAVETFPFALLVVRPEMDLSPRGREVLRQLEPHRLSKSRRSRWPGTELFGAKAEVHLFSLSPECGEILRKACRGLFDWQQPELPEDLCFLRSDGEAAVITTAHEGTVSLAVTPEEGRGPLLAGD